MGPLLLCYHAISGSWPSALAVRPDQFESHVALLRRRGFRFATVDAALTAPRGERVAAISFDDALRSVAEQALPILDALGAVGTVYAPAGLVDGAETAGWPGVKHWREGPYRSELTVMSWDELSRLASEGWQVGSHTISHPRLPDLAEAELELELAGSKREIESRLGTECTSLAYPYGAFDARVRELARRAGYANAVGTARRRPTSTGDRYSIPRTVINHVDTERRFAIKTSATARRVTHTAAWRAVNRVRRSLTASRAAARA